MIDPILALTLFLSLVTIGFITWKYRLLSRLTTSDAQKRKELVEDVLKQLFHVEYSGHVARLNDMAGALKLSDKKLLEVIEYTTQKGLMIANSNELILTDSGREYALKIIRIHRLWEKYLSEKTGFDKSEWHDIAELKEHTLSSEDTEKLYQDLGNPRFDPHGDPIPTKSGDIMNFDWISLSTLPSGTQATIIHLEDEPEVIYKQIIQKDLHIGSHLNIIESNDKEIKFYCEGKEFSLSPIVASNISVKELSEEEVFEESQVRLSALNEGEEAKVVGISSECRGANRRRLLDLGFIEGTPIKTEYDGPMNNPKAYLIRNTLIALRNDQAELILIEKE